MPLPIIFGSIIFTKIIGTTSMIYGGVKLISGGEKSIEAGKTMKNAKERDELAKEKLKLQTNKTNEALEKLEKEKLEIINSFDEFVKVWEKIHNRPKIEDINLQDSNLPEFDYKKFKTVLVTPEVSKNIFSSIIISKGITTVLRIAFPEINFLLGSIVFDKKSKQFSENADKTFEQVKENEKSVDEACLFLNQLSNVSTDYYNSLSSVKKVYYEKLNYIEKLVNAGSVDWNTYSKNDCKTLENLALLVKLLFEMCKVQLVTKNGKEINTDDINTNIKNANDQIKAINNS